MKRTFLTLALLALAPAAYAQAPINPTKITFTASVDHSTVVGSTPIVDHYEFQTIAMNPAGVIAFTRVLGKPTPDGTGSITATISDFATLANGVYTGKVLAVGPGGTTPSVVSDPFGRVGPPAAAGKPTVN